MKRILILFLVLSLSGNCFGAAIVQWKMNDNAKDAVVADSVGSYTGTFHDANNNYTYDNTTTGQINEAFDLDGTSDYITVSDAAAFTPDGTPMSITAWVSLSADEGAADFMTVNKMGTAVEWHFHISNDQLALSLYDESAGKTTIGRLDTTTDYALYEGSGFIFIVGTYDGGSSSTGIKLYLHDQQVDDTDNNSGTFTNVDDSSEDLELGRYDIGYAKGVIDNVVIYDTVLTEAQVINLYNNGVGTEEVGSGSLESTAENIARPRTPYGYRKYYRNRY